MPAGDPVRALFRPDRAELYDFSQLPRLVTLRDRSAHEVAVFEEDRERWSRMQEAFIRWTRDRGSLPDETVRARKAAFDRFFANRGLLRGRVLDIGGGWGLFREWWEPRDDGVFVVHDPGLERLQEELPAPHRELYTRALGLPMTFVEGFGESLPYKEEAFDVCLIANTLYHCVRPDKVVQEAVRCLKPGGELLLITDVGAIKPAEYDRQGLAALLVLLRHPRNTLGRIRRWLTRQEVVIRHLSVREMEGLLTAAGLVEIDSVPPVPGLIHFHTMAAAKTAATES